MNYYERHLGDYARDAGHLSMLEHGAYTLLLDRYYTTEQGIPADQAHRICRARTKEERAAVEAVLGEFFTLRDGLWTNGRAEREVLKMQSKIEAARTNGQRGGRPKKNPGKTQEKPSGLLVGSVLETQTKAHQTPDTRHQLKTEARTERGAPGFDPGDATPTPAGLICRVLRAAGITTVNPGHPTLQALLEAGATEAEFVGLVPKAASKRDPFAYLLGALASQREEAAQTAQGLHRGLLPAASQPVTVPSTDTRGDEFLAEQDRRAKEATRPPKDVLALARKAVRTTA